MKQYHIVFINYHRESVNVMLKLNQAVPYSVMDKTGVVDKGKVGPGTDVQLTLAGRSIASITASTVISHVVPDNLRVDVLAAFSTKDPPPPPPPKKADLSPTYDSMSDDLFTAVFKTLTGASGA
jgi:hypothetical protein